MNKKEPTGERMVDVLLQVTEPAKPSEKVVVTQSTYRRGNRSAQNRARASERIARPEGTRIAIIDSGPAGCFDDLIEDD